MAGSHHTLRSRRRASTRRATPRPGWSPTALRSLSMAAMRPTPEASWARASTGCWRSIPMRCWPCAVVSLGARLGQRSDTDAAVPGASRRELHRQWLGPTAELRAGVGRWGASLWQRDHVTRQIRRRVRLALIDLRRNGNVPIQVVRAVTRPQSSLRPISSRRRRSSKRLAPPSLWRARFPLHRHLRCQTASAQAFAVRFSINPSCMQLSHRP
jgi:hypothetical protein